jgi:hypothetical protein
MTTPRKSNGKQTTSGRKANGKFASGNNLGGRTKGSRHKATMAVESLLEGQVEQLTQKAVDAALAGDMTAMRLCLERLCPARKSHPIQIDLPKVETVNDVAKAHGVIITAMAVGDVTPDEASTIASVLESKRKAIETVEMEARLVELERKS